MTIIEQIKAEIERRLKDYWKICFHDVKAYNEDSNVRELKELLSFISTLESEKPMNQEGLEKELEKEINKAMKSDLCPEEISNYDFCCIARHFAEWGAEHAKIDVTDFCKPIEPSIAKCIADNWWEMLGEDENPVPKDLEEAADEYEKGYYDDCSAAKRAAYHGFIAGAEWQKEQMMKEAVEGVVMDFSSNQPRPQVAVYVDPHKYHTGDKVRIIIVKE